MLENSRAQGLGKAIAKEKTMSSRPGTRLAGIFFAVVAIALVVYLSGTPVCAQLPAQPSPPPPAFQTARPAIPGDAPSPSKVFPDGGFPETRPSAEGNIPAAVVKLGQPIAYNGQQPPAADYAPAGSTPRGPQEAPGTPEFYHPTSDPMPDYFFRPSYFDTPGVGARALADYAPPGYEAREVDEGQAPGVPEFTPIPTAVPVTPEERQKFVTRGLFPGSFLVPGTDTSFRFRGFVRLTGLYDFNPIGSRDDFVTNTIPVPQQSGQNYNVAARYSRIGLDTWTPTTFFNWNVHTFIEADFFNGPAQAVGGGGNPFRLRFAFIDFGYFRVGQQNTVFMDGNAFPTTVDFAGPRGLVNQRRPGARVTIPLADQLLFAAGIEQPFSDITTNGQGTPVQDVPDFAAHLRYEADYGHVQLSTLLRSIGFQPTGGEVNHQTGWGFSASTVFHPWALLCGSNPVRNDNPTGLDRSRILLQYTLGWGIGRYIQDTAGLGLDGEVNPATGAFETVYAAGWSASYEHWFTENWLANVTYSADFVASAPGQTGDTYAGAKYLTTALWWIPVRRMSVGIEYVWGQRENLDGQRARANRVNGLVQYNG
jgi:hypothetical protein